MNPLLNSIVYVGLFLLIPIQGRTQTACELKTEKDGIKIYSCPTKESAFNAIRVEFEVNSTIDKYISIVQDIARYKEWRYREFNHKLLKRISDTELIYYAQVSAPFPVSNRDLVLHLVLEQDSVTKVLTVTIESIPDYIPVVDKVIRVPKSMSKMTLTPMDETKLKVTCFVQLDPGGQIPAWVSNMFSTQAPYETFKNLIMKMEAK